MKKLHVPEELAKMVRSDLHALHETLSYDSFRYKLDYVRSKWSQYQALQAFSSYFIKEWCFHNNEWSRFFRWQFFHTPCGVATTNNCLESFNKQIKNVYTQNEIHTVYHFILIIMQKIINQYSYAPKEFLLYRAPDFDIIKEANKICDNNRDGSIFLSEGLNSY